MVSRLTPLKRADLLIEALATPDGAGIQAVIAGEGEERARLEALVARRGLDGRVRSRRPARRRRDCWSISRGAGRCASRRVQEDYGFVTVEAFASRKAVVTCRDSGGPAELVQDGVNGFVVRPDPGGARARAAAADGRRGAGRADGSGGPAPPARNSTGPIPSGN